jgi:hypothetical protein
MSRWSQTFLALLAASLAYGAVHLEIASGSDLKALTRGDASLFGSRLNGAPRLPAVAVNRATKSDRLAGVATTPSGPTIVFMVPGLKNTSVATFLPASQGSTSSGMRSMPKPILGTIACEPPVSALTEAARMIASGRCVT